MNLLRTGKDLFEKLTTRKVVLKQGFPFVSLRRRFLKVRLDFTSGCNLRCIMCPTVAAGGFERREMPLELFNKIAKEVFPKTEHLTIGCGAEPLLAKNFDLFLRTVKAYRIPYTLIISNGSLLSKQRIDSLLDAGIDEISISLEASSKEKYESIRVGAKFDHLLENLNQLNELKAQRGVDRPLLSFNTVLMKTNLSELAPLARLAKRMGASTFSMAHLIPFGGLNNEKESLYYHQELACEKIQEAKELAESLGLRVFSPPLFGAGEKDDQRPTEKGQQGMVCLQPWTFMVITDKGDVSPCGWLYGENPVGSFREQSFRQIWFGSEYARLREEIRTGNLRSRCAKCPAAGVGDPNRMESFEQVNL